MTIPTGPPMAASTVAVITCAVLLAAVGVEGCSSGGGSGSRHPRSTATTAAPGHQAGGAAERAAGRAAALATLARAGRQSFAEAGTFAPGTLSAFAAYRRGLVNGRGVVVYFFLGARFLRTDVTRQSEEATTVSSDGATVRVRYYLYRSSDPGCCPTGGTKVVRFHWNGSALIALDPIPPVTGSPHR